MLAMLPPVVYLPVEENNSSFNSITKFLSYQIVGSDGQSVLLPEINSDPSVYRAPHGP
jgi:hypothetical protein